MNDKYTNLKIILAQLNEELDSLHNEYDNGEMTTDIFEEEEAMIHEDIAYHNQQLQNVKPN